MNSKGLNAVRVQRSFSRRRAKKPIEPFYGLVSAVLAHFARKSTGITTIFYPCPPLRPNARLALALLHGDVYGRIGMTWPIPMHFS